MTLTFERSRVERLLTHTRAATAWRPLYEQPETAKPGLWLVGDQGIYLMDNTTRPLLQDGTIAEANARPGSMRCYVAYPRECNPDRQAFDEWWYAKRQAFGGDDGSDFIDAVTIDRWLLACSGKEWLDMELTPTRREMPQAEREPSKKRVRPSKRTVA